MHFEFLVEDQSGKAMLDRLVPEILGSSHTYRIIDYKGACRIPPNLNPKTDPAKRILLDQLPRLLAGHGKVFASYPADYRAAVILVCDLDNRDLKDFTAELRAVADGVTPSPKTEFCIAVEEGDAWFLGDLEAVTTAYPNAKKAVLKAYKNDAICGTWETLADAVYPGGAAALKAGGFQVAGAEKSRWAENITPYMEPLENQSPSFNRFLATLETLVGGAT